MFCDYDLDGDLDLYLLTHQLIRAGGRPSFRLPLVTVPGQTQPAMDAEWSRYYAVEPNPEPNGEWSYREVGRPDLLLRNDGGKFVDVSMEAGISRLPAIGNSATWWDFNGDGYPDLYVANDQGDPDHLYQNLGNGTFRDVAAEAAPHSVEHPWRGRHGRGRGRVAGSARGGSARRLHYKEQTSRVVAVSQPGALTKQPGIPASAGNALFLLTRGLPDSRRRPFSAASIAPIGPGR